MPFLLVWRNTGTWYERLRREPPPPASWGGTSASWLGMSLSAACGFGLARRWGNAFARLFARDEDLERMRQTSERFGPVFLVMMRGVPVLSEASVLLVGLHQLTWRRFFPPILISNLVLSFVYSAFGEFSEQHQWLPLAIGVSIAMPVLLAVVVRRYWLR